MSGDVTGMALLFDVIYASLLIRESVRVYVHLCAFSVKRDE